MIDPKAVPIGNRNPYKRVDLAAKRQRPRTITHEEILDNIHPAPDTDAYWMDLCGNWHLHEDQ